ncbi:hypothetical protein ADUPG1_014108, partial [Aduncisulcus paluster]
MPKKYDKYNKKYRTSRKCVKDIKYVSDDDSSEESELVEDYADLDDDLFCNTTTTDTVSSNSEETSDDAKGSTQEIKKTKVFSSIPIESTNPRKTSKRKHIELAMFTQSDDPDSSEGSPSFELDSESSPVISRRNRKKPARKAPKHLDTGMSSAVIADDDDIFIRSTNSQATPHDLSEKEANSSKEESSEGGIIEEEEEEEEKIRSHRSKTTSTTRSSTVPTTTNDENGKIICEDFDKEEEEDSFVW